MGLHVIRSEHAGACYGVERALDMAHGVIDRKESAHTLGPLIHNPQVVAELSAAGIDAVDNPEEVTSGAVIIRSHGVVPQVHRDLMSRDLEVIDATCPYVARAQKAAARLAREGCFVIVVGEAGHPEVEGLLAHVRDAGGDCAVVCGPDDIPADLIDPVGVVVQTTQEKANLDAVVDALEKRSVDPIVKNTICHATSQRQEAARELASRVSSIVVIGGRNSSNTTRLAQICRETCESVHHIESVDELDPAWFVGVDTVGVTAGASTPQDQIDIVVDYLESLSS